MALASSPSLSVIIIVVVIVLLLVALWLLNESRKKQYYDDAMKYILAPERAPVVLTTWETSSGPDPDGVLCWNATATLEGLADEVELVLQSKDELAMKEFVANAKFRFSPIYTRPPVDIFQALRRTAGPRGGLSRQASSEMTHVAKAGEPAVPVLGPYDLRLDFGPKISERSAGRSQADRAYYAVAFNIDPTIYRNHPLGSSSCGSSCSCDRRHSYYTNQTDITATVSALEGSVDASLGWSIPILSTGQSATLSLYNPDRYWQYLYVHGRSLYSNTYRLTGTWYAY